MTFFVQLGYCLTKQSSSKLRALVQLVKNTPFPPSKFNGQMEQFQQWFLRLHGKDIGRIGGYATPQGFRIENSHILPQFQGLGLGKKFYGELMKQAPQRTLHSDSQVSNAATRVWEGMAKRPGYTVTKSPAATTTTGGLITHRQLHNSLQLRKYQQSTPLLKRLFGLGKPTPVNSDEVFKATLKIPARVRQ